MKTTTAVSVIEALDKLKVNDIFYKIVEDDYILYQLPGGSFNIPFEAIKEIEIYDGWINFNCEHYCYTIYLETKKVHITNYWL